MSNMAHEISYKVGSNKQLWPNHNDAPITETAKLLRQVCPDRLQIDQHTDLMSHEELDSNCMVKQTYLDLGPATRKMINATSSKKQAKIVQQTKYLQKFDKILYSLANRAEG